jgi:tripartite-type tricarboxylate transporter receptor subunit TctC
MTKLVQARRGAPSRRSVLAVATAIALGALHLASPAQPAPAPASASPSAGYPTKPIRLVVTFPPGGSSDAVVRIVAPKLSQRLGQQVIVDNRAGAGGNIGLAIVAKAEPDGYTIGVGAAGGLAANVSLYPKMPFDPVKDFAPISLLANIPFVLVAGPDFPAKTLPDVMARAKASPGSLMVGHGGNGTAMHLSVQLWKQMTGVNVGEVAYRGSGPAAVDAMAGQVPLSLVDLSAALPQVKVGRLQAIAVTSDKRLADLPDVPTFAEAGVPNYVSIGWFGFVAPAGTSPAVLKRLHDDIQASLDDPEVRALAANVGVELSPSTPADFGAFIRSEITKWNRVITVSGTKLE